MELSAGEREYLNEMRMLSTNNVGDEIFVGLTPEESKEYYEFSRLHYRFNGDSNVIDRYLELHGKMETARFQVLGAERSARDDNSSRH